MPISKVFKNKLVIRPSQITLPRKNSEVPGKQLQTEKALNKEHVRNTEENQDLLRSAGGPWYKLRRRSGRGVKALDS